MLKQQTTHRQPDESTPVQETQTPQAELARIKETDRTLAGFVRCLQIIRNAQNSDCRFFTFTQSCGWLNRRWLDRHSETCSACIGALLCWFFGGAEHLDRFDEDNGQFQAGDEAWRFEIGFGLLDRQLGVECAAEQYHQRGDMLENSKSVRQIGAIIAELSGDDDWYPGKTDRPEKPYSATPWPVPYLPVFERLAAMHPGK